MKIQQVFLGLNPSTPVSSDRFLLTPFGKAPAGERRKTRDTTGDFIYKTLQWGAGKGRGSFVFI